MADTIDVQISLNIASSLYAIDKFANFQDNLSVQGASAGIQDVSTLVETLDIGDVSSTDMGILFLKNLSETNYVTYGSSNLEFKVDPGECAIQRVNPGTTLYCKANSAVVKLERHLSAK